MSKYTVSTDGIIIAAGIQEVLDNIDKRLATLEERESASPAADLLAKQIHDLEMDLACNHIATEALREKNADLQRRLDAVGLLPKDKREVTQ